ncbi:MAG: hypothetical protein Q9220_000337 [cf. Caloplaca sp. 1 TL-2023]
MDNEAPTTALATLENLQARLQRIEFYLSGSDDAQQPLEAAISTGKDHSIAARLAILENTLHTMRERSPVVHDLLQLQSAHPALFKSSDSDVNAMPSGLSTEEILAIVTAHAPLYPLTASRLISIHDTPIPSTSLSTSLMALQPRLAELESLQETQIRTMAALRARSANAIQRWYELGVLGQGDCWADWEGRMEECEKRVRRVEGEKQRLSDEKTRYLS